jgi:hypothetical protein
MCYKNIFFILLVCSLSPLKSAETIKGTVEDKSTSFDFNVNNPVLSQFTSRGATVNILFTSAAQTPTDPTFTIARSSNINAFSGEPFIGMSLEKVKVNGTANSSNPLYGVATSLLTLSGSRLILKRNNLPAQIFVQDNIFGTPNEAHIYTTRGVSINDAASAASAGVQAIVAVTDYIFAAVSPNGGVFGEADSGIALIKLDTDRQVVEGSSDQDKLIPYLDVLNANDGTKNGNLPIRFDITTDALRIGSQLDSLGDVVDMHWDNKLKRLYIAVVATGGSGGTDGVRAVVMGRLSGDRLILNEIAPADVFMGLSDTIIGATGSSQTVLLFHVKTMHTSTGLSYLIVAGNNGVPGTVGNVVFSVPLTDKSNNKDFNTDVTHGTLANAHAEPQTFFKNGIFSSRAFTTPAMAVGDLLVNTDTAAQVGGGTLPLAANSQISDLFIVEDAVFASIATDYDGGTTEPGLYKSQAIFNEDGAIAAWSKWERVAGTDALIKGSVLDVRSNSFTYLTTNSAGTLSNTIKRTVWSDSTSSASGSKGFAALLDDSFEKAKGGVQGLFDFPRNTPTFSSVAGDQLSLVVATGFGNIVLAEMARDEGLDFKPYFGNYNGVTREFSTGVITTTFAAGGSTRAITMSGGVVATLGPISAASIATDGAEGFLAIGGVGGLAVLANPDGSGWTNLTNGFGGLTSGMKFFEVGNYSFVRRLVVDGTNLYVLTNRQLDRIDMASSNIATGAISVQTLATPESIGLSAEDSFSDVGTSNQVGLLATSQGLYRVGDGKDIRTGTKANLNWTNIPIPNAPGPATRLQFATTTGFDHDFSQNGQLYLLAAYTGFNQAQLQRYSINVSGSINASSIQPVPDLILKTPSFLINFGAFRNFLLDDGAIVTSTRSANNMPIDDPFIDPVTGLTQDPIQKREAFIKITQNERLAQDQIKVPFNLKGISNIANTIINGSSGALFVPGAFGLRVND